MSASRDRSSNVKFVYSNLYRIYRNGVDAAVNAEPFETGQVIRKEAFHPGLRIERHQASEFKARKGSPMVQPNPVADQAVSDLKKNLNTLNDLQSRMQFMLKEIEELLKK